MRWGRRLTSSPTEGSSLACGLPIHQHEKRGLPCCSTGAARHKHSPPKPAARSRLIIGDFGPSDSALAAARGWRLRRPAADRHAARCASRDLCSGGAPRRYPPSRVFMSKTAAAAQQAVSPSTWPSPPTEMSVSTLRELEACPRRWALSSARYPEIWDRVGYPPKLNIA